MKTRSKKTKRIITQFCITCEKTLPIDEFILSPGPPPFHSNICQKCFESQDNSSRSRRRTLKPISYNNNNIKIIKDEGKDDYIYKKCSSCDKVLGINKFNPIQNSNEKFNDKCIECLSLLNFEKNKLRIEILKKRKQQSLRQSNTIKKNKGKLGNLFKDSSKVLKKLRINNKNNDDDDNNNQETVQDNKDEEIERLCIKCGQIKILRKESFKETKNGFTLCCKICLFKKSKLSRLKSEKKIESIDNSKEIKSLLIDYLKEIENQPFITLFYKYDLSLIINPKVEKNLKGEIYLYSNYKKNFNSFKDKSNHLNLNKLKEFQKNDVVCDRELIQLNFNDWIINEIKNLIGLNFKIFEKGFIGENYCLLLTSINDELILITIVVNIVNKTLFANILLNENNDLNNDNDVDSDENISDVDSDNEINEIMNVLK